MRCPVCRAENVEAACRRCKADLSLLAALEEARAHALEIAAGASAAGVGDAALVAAERAHQLRSAADSWQMLALAKLLCKDYAGALGCWRAAHAK